MKTKSKAHRGSKEEKSSRPASRSNVETKKVNSIQEDRGKKSHQAGFSDSDNSRSARPIGFDSELTPTGVL